MLTIDLSQRTCLVTGASGELGRVMTRTLARCGADVVIHYRQAREKAEGLAAEVRGLGRRAMLVQADVGRPEDVAEMSRRVLGEMGKVDVVVANAVTQYTWTSVLQQEVADYESQWRSCVLQNVLLAKAFVPAMQARGWGRHIAISTECAMQCVPNQSAYVSGKRGMDGVLRVLAREVGPNGVTVNQVAPGWTISENRPAADDPGQNQYRANVPLRRRGTDQEIANAVAFLASDLASFITGVYLPVCGGNVMPTI